MEDMWPDDEAIFSDFMQERIDKVPSLRTSSTDTPMNWCLSSFEDFPNTSIAKCGSDLSDSARDHILPLTSQQSKGSFSTRSKKNNEHNLKRHRSVETLRAAAPSKLVSSDILWIDKYSPKDKAELAVHPKKISELEKWLFSYYEMSSNDCPYLLLTGPAGSGKTATLRLVAQTLACDVQEWRNVDSQREFRAMDNEDVRPGSHWQYDRYGSQVSYFRDFLLRSNRYEPLRIFHQAIVPRKLVLVEEFPNSFLRNAAIFHDVLRQFRSTARCPVVFIVSDSTTRDSIERTLFPKNIQTELGFTNICFNPVASTLLTKLLKRIISIESSQTGGSFTANNDDIIESLVLSGSGDIRATVNSLQFLRFQGNKRVSGSGGGVIRGEAKRPRRIKRKNDQDTTAPVNPAPVHSDSRDTSMSLFRALGKILYCKRLEKDTNDSSVPSHLCHHHRRALSFVPEEVVERSHVSSSLFLSYLHENYPSFFPDAPSIERASEYISDSDYIASRWQSRTTMEAVGVSIAVRGLLHSNHPCLTSHSWKPLFLSKSFDVHRKMIHNGENARNLFQRLRCSTCTLVTDMIPYMSLSRVTLHDPGQIQFLQEISKFPRCTQGMRANGKLGEKDVIDNEDDDEVSAVTNQDSSLSNSQSNFSLRAQEEEDENGDENYTIDDYDY